jgi:GMP synthase (glutamine-hydrolysing)
LNQPISAVAADGRNNPARPTHTVPIAILDFGSQYAQLIARRVRERHVYCEILRHDTPVERLRALGVRGVILSGGPASVLEPGAPRPDPSLIDADLPLLGLCYGMEILALSFGGRIDRGSMREYGMARVEVDEAGEILKDLDAFPAWMSHGDSVKGLPPDLVPLGHTDSCAFAAARHRSRPVYLLQFHPEVVHTKDQGKILSNFLFEICGVEPSWTMENFAVTAVQNIREQTGEGSAICALSGGVDSSVAAVLAARALGPRLTCIFVDHGLLRQGEAEMVTRELEEGFGLAVHHLDAADRFLSRLAGVSDPEEKRKRIWAAFIEVFEAEAKGLRDVRYLVQGTLYPDVVESAGVSGPAATIKSHHNVGGLPEKMGLTLIEPLRELFKDEVREVGRVLGIPESVIGRHPFPGPGLAVRVLGPVDPENLEVARRADSIFIEELRTQGLYDQVWQALAVLLPVSTVGVMGDERTYEQVIALRAVTSTDGMTADWGRLPLDFLGRVANRIVNEVRGVNRVVYDLSSKPPATIEWE